MTGPRSPLPVDGLLPELVEALRSRGAAVLHAPTGAGKTTRVPPALLDAVPGRILVLEPRRIAARAAAGRMAAERGERVGATIGYQVRFDRRIGPDTRVEVVTGGILLRRLQDDPFLTGIDAVVFDEFHERSLDQDLAFGWVRRLREDVRTDLLVVVMSATLDLDAASDALDRAPVIRSAGRLHPVAIEHVEREDDRPLERRVRSAVLDVLARTRGDVLVFLPGMAEIRRAERALARDREAHDADTVILHGDLAPADQDRALRRGPRRRVVLATNVAETSVTVEGVTAVVDSGLARVATLDAGVGVPRLEVTRIAQDAADQRAGRAGRLEPGLCVRLWTASRHRLLPARTPPEVRRADLAPALLTLLDWGETDPAAFPWLDVPSAAALERARADLTDLGALTPDGRLRPVGRELARLPVHPRLGRLLLAGREHGVAGRAALAAALLAERDPFERGREPVDHASESDVLDRVEALERFRTNGTLATPIGRLRPGPARQVLQAASQLGRLLDDRAPRRARDPDTALRRALLAAFADRLARRRAAGSDRAVLRGGTGVRLDARSGVRDAPLFVCVEIVAGRRGERAEAQVRQASAVERAWLDDAECTTTDELAFDAEAQRVRTHRVTAFHGLELRRTEVATARDAATAAVLAAAAAERLDTALGLDDPELAGWLERVAFLRAHRPELDLPSVERDDLVALLPELCLGSVGFAELARLDLRGRLAGRLTYAQSQALAREAPERIEVPSGSHVRLAYRGAEPPILAARIQELFGMHATPRIAAGRVPVLLHLLAPNHRPQQVTDDLESFWNTTYAVVRKDLRRRYPRHAWPEDPWTAEAERRPRRRRT